MIKKFIFSLAITYINIISTTTTEIINLETSFLHEERTENLERQKSLAAELLEIREKLNNQMANDIKPQAILFYYLIEINTWIRKEDLESITEDQNSLDNLDQSFHRYYNLACNVIDAHTLKSNNLTEEIYEELEDSEILLESIVKSLHPSLINILFKLNLLDTEFIEQTIRNYYIEYFELFQRALAKSNIDFTYGINTIKAIANNIFHNNPIEYSKLIDLEKYDLNPEDLLHLQVLLNQLNNIKTFRDNFRINLKNKSSAF